MAKPRVTIQCTSREAEHSKRCNSLNVYKFMMQLWSQLKMVWVKKKNFYTVLVEQGRHTFTTSLFLSCDQKKEIVLPVALSGSAALLLPAKRIAHFRFKIPMNLNEDSVCDIFPEIMLAELIGKTDLIIWDEAPMTNRHGFEATTRFDVH